MQPKYYEFHCPTKLLSGRKAIPNLPYELGQLAASRPMVITDQGIIKAGLMEQVSREIGRFARPKEIRFTEALPKTRSGKIMRRLLRKVAANDPTLGNIDTLEEISVLARLQGDEE